MSSPFIISECAQGYAQNSSRASVDLACRLVEVSHAAGADAVKFQMVIADELALPDYKYYKLFKNLELGFDGWREVVSLSEHLNIDIIFDIFGPLSLRLTEKLGVSSVKIHPTDFTNSSLLSLVSASTKIKSVYGGSGGATYNEVEKFLSFFDPSFNLVLVHGYQGYPTLISDNCLSRISLLKNLGLKNCPGIKIGFADHEGPESNLSSQLASVAFGCGATVIEKHLTLARCAKYEDHESAFSPDEFFHYVQTLRSVFSSLNPISHEEFAFTLTEGEKIYRQNIARHVVLNQSLTSGTVLSNEHLSLLRTSSSSPFLSLEDVIGRRLKFDVSANHALEPSMLN